MRPQAKGANHSNRRYRVLEAQGNEASPKFDDAQVDLYYIDAILDADADETIEETESGLESDPVDEKQ